MATFDQRTRRRESISPGKTTRVIVLVNENNENCPAEFLADQTNLLALLFIASNFFPAVARIV